MQIENSPRCAEQDEDERVRLFPIATPLHSAHQDFEASTMMSTFAARAGSQGETSLADPRLCEIDEHIFGEVGIWVVGDALVLVLVEVRVVELALDLGCVGGGNLLRLKRLRRGG